jgi:hypothetical protein
MRTFKEGDKLLCCRVYDHHLEIGTYYEISYYNDSEIGKFDGMIVNGYWFSNNKFSVYPYVYDYFFTEKEERKIKLQILKLHSKI